ncbi:MAG TPA: EAL domain-containing protein [Thermoanaerobaculia bacterium]|jgi:EAL domain-containing protein (putative c-di-GMP-specific phosphodiesterase class I)|nr:EAL domain-containing protein [Thermoanaerobaculia bacterium]
MTNKYAANTTGTVLILDGDRERAASSARTLAAGGGLVLIGRDAVLGALVARRVPLLSMVTEAQIAPFSFDGLDAVAAVRSCSPECRVVVVGDLVPPPVAEEALRRGAEVVLLRPFEDETFRRTCGAGCAEEGAVRCIPTIEELVESHDLLPAFQPIVDLAGDDRRAGFESLARFDQTMLPFCDPTFLFEYARLCGRTVDLDLACLRRTLRAAGDLARRGKIFINIHPRALADGPRLARTLVHAAAEGEVPLDRLVLEITEQEKLEVSSSTLPALEELRATGVELALDDVGSSYSHLDLIDRIRPSYLKISHEFGTGFESDAARCKIIRNIQSLARDFQCEIILEGVETEATSRAAVEIGARYAQGFYYARPGQAAAWVE